MNMRWFVVLVPSVVLAADTATSGLAFDCDPPFMGCSVSDEGVIHIPDITDGKQCVIVYAQEILADGKHYGYNIRYGKKVDCKEVQP